MADQTTREWMKELRTKWAALPDQDRAIIDTYIDATITRKPLSEKNRWFRRCDFLIPIDGLSRTAAEWVAEKRVRDEQNACRIRERDAQRAEEWRARTAVARDAYARKLEEMRAALARGESVPARFRPVGGHCAMCRKPLQDPESVRLGIGPECRRQLRLVSPEPDGSGQTQSAVPQNPRQAGDTRCIPNAVEPP